MTTAKVLGYAIASSVLTGDRLTQLPYSPKWVSEGFPKLFQQYEAPTVLVCPDKHINKSAVVDGLKEAAMEYACIVAQ